MILVTTYYYQMTVARSCFWGVWVTAFKRALNGNCMGVHMLVCRRVNFKGLQVSSILSGDTMVPLRLLSNAHATPHRLHKQDIVSTPACNSCGCEDADIIHIAFHCPKFQFIRDEWSPLTLTWPGWPACAQQCLVATTTMPAHIRKHWPTVQQDIARLFETWMSFRRNGNLLHSVTADPHAIEIQRAAETNALRSNPSHDVVERYAPLVQPPVELD